MASPVIPWVFPTLPEGHVPIPGPVHIRIRRLSTSASSCTSASVRTTRRRRPSLGQVPPVSEKSTPVTGESDNVDTEGSSAGPALGSDSSAVAGLRPPFASPSAILTPSAVFSSREASEFSIVMDVTAADDPGVSPNQGPACLAMSKRRMRFHLADGTKDILFREPSSRPTLSWRWCKLRPLLLSTLHRILFLMVNILLGAAAGGLPCLLYTVRTYNHC